MPIPPMIIPDGASTLCFVAIVLALAALFVAGVARAGRTLGEPSAVTRRWTARAALGIAGVRGLLATSGVERVRGALRAGAVEPAREHA